MERPREDGACAIDRRALRRVFKGVGEDFLSSAGCDRFAYVNGLTRRVDVVARGLRAVD